MITIVMGRPGAGKSTYLAIEAMKSLNKGRPVYSNVELNGCFKLDVHRDLNYWLIEDSLLIIDEAGFEFNSRNWKQFGDQLYRFFTMHRHYKCDIILAVQMWDRVDLCIREVTQRIVIVEPTIFNKWFIKYREVSSFIGIKDSQIIEQFEYLPILAGGLKYKYRCKAMKMFNSYYRDDLQVRKNWPKWNDQNWTIKQS